MSAIMPTRMRLTATIAATTHFCVRLRAASSASILSTSPRTFRSERSISSCWASLVYSLAIRSLERVGADHEAVVDRILLLERRAVHVGLALDGDPDFGRERLADLGRMAH